MFYPRTLLSCLLVPEGILLISCDSLYKHFVSFYISFVSSSCHISLARTSGTVLNKMDTHVFTDLLKKASSVSPLTVMVVSYEFSVDIFLSS